MTSPVKLSLARLRREGFTVDFVERWIPHTKHRRDLFGFADLIGAHPKEKRILLVQVTVKTCATARLKKSLARPELQIWFAAGGEFEIHAWARQAGRDQLSRLQVNPGDCDPVFLERPRRRRNVGKWKPADLFD